jgi:hypothetical protein
MEFKSLFALKSFLEKAPISKIWGFRLRGSYTIFTGNDMVELHLNPAGGCRIEYTIRTEPVQVNGKPQCQVRGTIISHTSSAGYPGVIALLDRLLIEVNYARSA